MLIFESVVKHFARRHALGPLSLRVAAKSVVAVTGPPGAGKTTLVRIALGLVSPDAGIVIVGGVAPPPGDTLWQQSRFIAQDETLRNFVLNEPRGGVFRHVNLLVPARDPRARMGWIIMEPADTPPTSGRVAGGVAAPSSSRSARRSAWPRLSHNSRTTSPAASRPDSSARRAATSPPRNCWPVVG